MKTPAKRPTPPPPEGLPVEKIALIAGLGLGAALLLWGAALLLAPKPRPVAKPVEAPAPPPAPPAEETTEDAPMAPGVFPPAPAADAAPAKAAPVVVPSKTIPPLPRPIRADGTPDDTVPLPPPMDPK